MRAGDQSSPSLSHLPAGSVRWCTHRSWVGERMCETQIIQCNKQNKYFLYFIIIIIIIYFWMHIFKSFSKVYIIQSPCMHLLMIGRNDFNLLSHSVWFVSKRWEGRVCKYMHARTIDNVLARSRTVQKGGSNPSNPPPGKSHFAFTCTM